MSPGLFDLVAILLTLACGLALLNHHVLRLPFTIGILVSSLVASLLVLGLEALAPGLGLADAERMAVSRLDFSETLLHGMLGFLLFAGALHVDLDDLASRWPAITSLASVGLLISTALVGVGSWLIFGALGLPVPFIYCLIFGALISPTDPIAVLSILKSAGAPPSLAIKVAGESLFNDGFAVVIFSVLLSLAGGGHGHAGEMGAGTVAVVFLREVVGGIALGLIAGWIAYRAMRTLEEPNLEVLISVALVTGVTALAFRLHSSAPLACVAAGLFIGNHGRRMGMGAPTRASLDRVWSFVDEALNAVLFLLMGLEVVVIRLHGPSVLAGVVLIPAVLLARWISVAGPISLLRAAGRTFSPGAIRVLTWGGLKGGISIALALSLPEFEGRATIVTVTYVVVIFSVVVQGLTVGRLIRAITPPHTKAPGEPMKDAPGAADQS